MQIIHSYSNIKLSKFKLHKIGQSGGFSRRLLEQLLKNGLLLMKNLLKPVAKSILIPLRLTAAASATDTTIHKKMFGSRMTKLIFSNEVRYHENNQITCRIWLIDKRSWRNKTIVY